MISIHYSTSEYRFNHGAAPRGRGSWAFFVKSADVGGPAAMHVATTDDVGTAIWARAPRNESMTFVEARRWMTSAIRAMCALAGVRDAFIVVEVAS